MPENPDVDDEHLREAEALRLRHISEEQLRMFEGYNEHPDAAGSPV